MSKLYHFKVTIECPFVDDSHNVVKLAIRMFTDPVSIDNFRAELMKTVKVMGASLAQAIEESQSTPEGYSPAIFDTTDFKDFMPDKVH